MEARCHLHRFYYPSTAAGQKPHLTPFHRRDSNPKNERKQPCLVRLLASLPETRKASPNHAPRYHRRHRTAWNVLTLTLTALSLSMATTLQYQTAQALPRVALLGHKGKPKSRALLLARIISSSSKRKQNGTTPTTRIARCPRAIHHLLASAGPSIVLIRTKMEEQPSQDIPQGGQESERIMHPPEEENSQEPFQRLHSSQDRLLQLW